MMVMDFTITNESIISPRRWNRIKRDTYALIAKKWIDTNLRKHFTKQGAREYAYVKRDGEGASGKGFKNSYTGMKKRVQGHTDPLRFTGRLEKEALSGSKVTNKTKHGATIVIPGRVLNLKPGKNKIDMAKEISTVSTREIQQMIQDAQQKLQSELRKGRLAKETITIR